MKEELLGVLLESLQPGKASEQVSFAQPPYVLYLFTARIANFTSLWFLVMYVREILNPCTSAS
jgi:hypothetical protein